MSLRNASPIATTYLLLARSETIAHAEHSSYTGYQYNVFISINRAWNKVNINLINCLTFAPSLRHA